MKGLNAFWLWLSFASQLAFAQDDFDFGVESPSDDTISFPLVLKLGLKRGEQIADPKRPIFSGASIHEKLHFSHSDFTLHVEGTGFYNTAYRSESDPDPVVQRHELEWITRETYVTYVLGSISFNLGRKIEVFGKNDILSTFDVI